MRIHQRSEGSGDHDQSLARLVAQVDQVQHDLAALTASVPGLRTDVDTHTRTLADLTDLLRRVTSSTGLGGSRGEASDEGQVVPEWMTVTDPALAIGWLNQLTVWVRDVYARYTPVQGCWAWHPPVVAELLACQGAWTAAVHPDAPLEALAGWHDRWRPGTTTRVTKTLTACGDRADGLHVEGITRYDFDPAALDEYAQHWAGTHNPNSSDAPGLTLNREIRR